MKQIATLLLAISSLSLCAKELVNLTPKQRNIVVTNNIEERMTTYTFLGTEYLPEFHCTINGSPIKPGCKAEIPLVDNKLVVSYRYNFAKGYYKGAKEVIFEVAPDKKECALGFSWSSSSRVLVSGAKPKTIKKISYPA